MDSVATSPQQYRWNSRACTVLFHVLLHLQRLCSHAKKPQRPVQVRILTASSKMPTRTTYPREVRSPVDDLLLPPILNEAAEGECSKETCWGRTGWEGLAGPNSSQEVLSMYTTGAASFNVGGSNEILAGLLTSRRFVVFVGVVKLAVYILSCLVLHGFPGIRERTMQCENT